MGSVPKKQVFLAAPFKSLIEPATGTMTQESRERLTTLIEFLESKNFDVHCAHKREAWGKDMMSPEECTYIDFTEIKDCDYFVAFPGSPASPGTHIEIGWASAFGKDIVLLLENGKEYAFLIRGLSQVSNVTEVWFSTEQEYLQRLESILVPATRE